MHLRSTDGSEFTLKIEDYEFSAMGKDRYDANWLVISIDVKSPQGEWKARGPYLLQWEAEQLGTWLEGASKDARLPANLAFTDDLSFAEPNLKFELGRRSEDFLILRIHFEIEFRPPRADKYQGESYVDLDLSRGEMVNAARAWRAELKAFPPRKV